MNIYLYYFVILILIINLSLSLCKDDKDKKENYCGGCRCRWGCECERCKSKYVNINTKEYEYLINKPNLTIGTWIFDDYKDPLKSVYMIFEKNGYGVIQNKGTKENDEFTHYGNMTSSYFIQLSKNNKVFKVKIDKDNIDKLDLYSDNGIISFKRIRTLPW